MTDSTDENRAEGRGGGRKRGSIYGERRIVSVRLEPELHGRMMDYCNEVAIPANTYITDLIESNLKKRKK